MVLDNVSLGKKIENILLQLSLNTELLEGKRFRTNKTKELMNLLKFSRESENKTLQSHFRDFCQCVKGSALEDLFKNRGIELSLKSSISQNALYRGSPVHSASNDDTKAVKNKTATYRGAAIKPAQQEGEVDDLMRLTMPDNLNKKVRMYRGNIIAS